MPDFWGHFSAEYSNEEDYNERHGAVAEAQDFYYQVWAPQQAATAQSLLDRGFIQEAKAIVDSNPYLQHDPNGRPESQFTVTVEASVGQTDNGTAEPNSKNPKYNCAAWAFGYDNVWIQAGGDFGVAGQGVTVTYNNGTRSQYSEMMSGTENLPTSALTLPSRFGGKGATADSKIDSDRYRIITINDKSDAKLWHVMKQDAATGLWSSKNGVGQKWVNIKDPIAFYKQYFPNDKRKSEKDLQIKYYSMPNKPRSLKL